MKKALLIALLAMMLISMLVTACKPKVEEPVDEAAPVEEVAPAVDTTAVAPVDPATTTTTTTTPAPGK